MATNKNDGVKKTAEKIKSPWLQNALKSMGVASADIIKDMVPATAETLSSISSLATETATSLKTNKSRFGIIEKALKNNPVIKLAQDSLGNALDDIKTGNLYNTERGTESFTESFDQDHTNGVNFEDIPDDGSTDVNIQNNYNSDNSDSNATIKAIQASSKYQVESAKAVMDTMTSINATNSLKMAEISTNVISHISSIDKNIAALIDYSNNNITRFIEASIAYYESQSKAKKEDPIETAARVTQDNLFTANGGFDVKSYLEYVKGNIKENSQDGLVGGTLSMLLENKGAFNPLAIAINSGLKKLIPEVTKRAAEEFDNTLKDYIPNILEDIGELADYSGSDDELGIRAMFGRTFGIKTKRTKSIDLSKIEKGPIPYNGIANHTIVEIIPKYLRESNSYLKQIAMSVTGKDNTTLLKGTMAMDWSTGKFTDIDTLQKNVFENIKSDIEAKFASSKFGQHMTKLSSNLSTDKEKEDYSKALSDVYALIERHSGKIDLSNPDHRKEIINNIDASDTIKNLISAAFDDIVQSRDGALIGSLNSAKRAATRSRNAMLKNYSDEIAAGTGQYVAVNDNLYIKEFEQRGLENSDNSQHIQTPPTPTIQSPSDQTINKKQPSVIGWLENIYRLLDRGIYVKTVRRKLKDIPDVLGSTESVTGNDEETQEPSISNAQPSISVETFRRKLSEERERNARIKEESVTAEDGDSTYTLINKGVSKKLNTLSGIMQSIMAGDADSAWDTLMTGVRNVFTKAGDFLTEHFINPMKKSLFGTKDENGYIHNGIIAGVNNSFKESFFKLRRMVTGKGYVASDGTSVSDAEGDDYNDTIVGKVSTILTNLKESISVRLFGEKDDNDEVTKEGLVHKFKHGLHNAASSLLSGLHGWKKALFGDKGDDESEEAQKKTWEEFKERATKLLPHAVTGGILGLGANAIASSGLLGVTIGGPAGIPAILLGASAAFLSKSEKFKDWLFGPEGDDGQRVGGVISKQVQEYFRDNSKFLAGGAIVGSFTGGLTGGGILGSLVGGPIAGALMGTASSMILRSQMFQKFLYGDERAGKLGLIKTVKNMFSKFGENTGKIGDGGKLAGMMAIGGGAGAITGQVLLNSGLFGLALGPAGPIGGAILGLGTSILAQKDNFKEWLFGKVDEDGNKHHGIIGQFGNMLSVSVFKPLSTEFKRIGANFKTFLYYDVLDRLNLIIEPVGNAVFGTLSKIAGKSVDTLADIGRYIKDDFLNNVVSKIGNILGPVTKAAGTLANGFMTAAETVASVPIKILSAITSPVAMAIGKTVATAGKLAFKTVENVIVKPVNALVIKPLSGIVKFAGEVIAAPFKAISNMAEFFADKMDTLFFKMSNFLSLVGTDIKNGMKKLLFENPVSKWIGDRFKDAKDFGVRVKDTISLIFNPLTEYIKATIKGIATSTVNSVKKVVFGILNNLNPLTWIKRGGNLIRKVAGLAPKQESKNKGYLARKWEEAGQGLRGYKNAQEMSNAARRKENKKQKILGKEVEYYEDKNGLTYFKTADNKAYRVYNSRGDQIDTIDADELPNRDELTKKTTGVDGKITNRKKHRANKQHDRNAALIAKYTNYQRTEDTEENRKLAQAAAKKVGKTLDFGKIDPIDDDKNRVNAQIAEEQSEAIINGNDAQHETNNILSELLLTVKAFLHPNDESIRQEYEEFREKKRKEKERQEFILNGGSSGITESQRLENTTFGSTLGSVIGENVVNGTNNEHAAKSARRIAYDNAFAQHGLFGGMKAAGQMLVSEIKASLGEVNEDYRNKKADKMLARAMRRSTRRESVNLMNDIPEIPNTDVEASIEELPHYAAGTTNARAGLAVVGELGPEIINLRGGETITPTDQINTEFNNDYMNIMCDILREINSNISGILSRTISIDNTVDEIESDDTSPVIEIPEASTSPVNNITLPLLDDAISTRYTSGLQDTESTETPQASVAETNNERPNLMDSIDIPALPIHQAQKLDDDIVTKFTEQQEAEERREEREEQAKVSMAEVTSLTMENKTAEMAAAKEDAEDDAREERENVLMEDIKNAIGGTFKKGGNVLQSIGSLFSKIPSAIKTLFVGTGLVALAPSIISFIKQAGPYILSGAKWLFEKGAEIIPVIGEKIKTVSEKAVKFVDEHGPEIIQTAIQLKDSAVEAITDLKEAIMPVLEGIKTFVGNIFSQIGWTYKNDALENGENVIERASQEVKNVASGHYIYDENGELTSASSSRLRTAAKVGAAVINPVHMPFEPTFIRQTKNLSKNAHKIADTVGAVGSSIGHSAANTAKSLGNKVANSKVGATLAKPLNKVKSTKLFTQINGFIDNLFKTITEKFFKKNPSKLSQLLKTVKSGISKKWDELVSLIAKKLGKEGSEASIKTVAAGLTGGITKLAFVTAGAIDGRSGAAKLFKVDADAVDDKMKNIATVIGGLLSTTALFWIDPISSVLQSILGIDLISALAVAIYNGMASEEEAEMLKLSQEDFKLGYVEYQEEEIEKQYETQKAAGIIDSNVTLEEFTKGAHDGTYKVKYDSFADYNTKKNKSISDKLLDGGSKLVKGASKGIKSLFGVDEKYYEDSSGNQYYKNDDGSYRVIDSAGNNLGNVSKDAISKDAVEKTKENKSFMADLGENIKIGYKEIGKGITETVDNMKLGYKEIGKGITNTADKLKKGFGEGIDNIKLGYKEIGKGITTTVGNLKTGFNGVVEKLKAGFGNTVENVRNGFVNGVENLKVGYKEISKGITDTVDKVKVGFTNVGNLLKNKITNTVDNIKNKISAGMETFKTGITDGIANFKNKFTDAIDKIKGGFTGIVDKIKKKLGWFGGSGDDFDTKDTVATGAVTGATMGITAATSNYIQTGQGGRGAEPSTLNGSTYYSQNDSRWSNKKFVKSDGTDDGSTMGNTGCGPTAMAMAVSDITGNKVSPVEMARFSQETGTRDNTGVNSRFVDNVSNVYGLNSHRNDTPDAGYIKNNVDSNRPMVLLGQDSTGSTPYTDAGHYVVAVGKDNSGNIIINDPRGKSHSRKVNASKLASHTGVAWSFNKPSGGFGIGSLGKTLMSKFRNKIKGGRGAGTQVFVGGGVKSYKYNSTEQLSTHFNAQQFRCKCGGNHDTLISGDLVYKLEVLFDTLGASNVVINSGYRCSAHDSNVDGTRSGAHVKGLAVDIKFLDNADRSINTKIISCIAQDIGFTGIANVNTSYSTIHLDVRDWGIYYGDETVNYKHLTDDFYKYYGLSGDYVSKYKVNNNSLVSQSTLATTEEQPEKKTFVDTLAENISTLGSTMMDMALTGNTDVNWESKFTKYEGSGQGGRGEYQGTTYYSQNDGRWSHTKYRRSDGTDDGSTMGNSGCGPTAMAMAVSDITGKQTTPLELAKYAQLSGNRDGNGTNAKFISDAASEYGIPSRYASNPSAGSIVGALRENRKPMVLLGKSSGGSDKPYTTNGHYVVATGYDSNGNIMVNDPRGIKYSKKYNPNQLASDTMGAWVFDNPKQMLGGRGPITYTTTSTGNTYLEKPNITYTSPEEFVNDTVISASGNVISGASSEDIKLFMDIANNVRATLRNYGPKYGGIINVKLYDRNISITASNLGFIAACVCLYSCNNNAAKLSVEDIMNTVKNGVSKLKSVGFKYQSLSTGWLGVKTGDICVFKGQYAGIYHHSSGGTHYLQMIKSSQYNNGINSTDYVKFTGYSNAPIARWRPGKPGYSVSTTKKESQKETTTEETTAIPEIITYDMTTPQESQTFLDRLASKLSTLANVAYEGAITGTFNDINWKEALADPEPTTTTSSVGGVTSSSSLTGNSNVAKIWNYLRKKGFTKAGTAGLMGNLQAESGLIPTNLQNDYEVKLGMNDTEYTSAVDSGKYPRGSFIDDEAGYGLAQWTPIDRKSKLYDYAKSTSRGIGDLSMQLDYLYNELSTGYPTVFSKLKSATNIRDASDPVLTKFEVPADMGYSVKVKRGEFGQQIYDHMSDIEDLSGSGDGPTVESYNPADFEEPYTDELQSDSEILGGFGEEKASISTKKYDTTIRDTNINNNSSDITIKPIRTEVNMSRTNYRNSNNQLQSSDVGRLETIMNQVVDILKDISTSSKNLSVLNDIKSGLKSSNNNLTNNVTNNIVANNSNTQTKVKPTNTQRNIPNIPDRLSKNEETARRIAFGY